MKLRTRMVPRLSAKELRPNTPFIYSSASGSDERLQLGFWRSLSTSNPGLSFEVTSEPDIDVAAVRCNGESAELNLRNPDDFESIVGSQNGIYIDTTGMSLPLCAALVRSCKEFAHESWLIYTAPETYTPRKSPSSPGEFDLTETGTGEAPLPGFASLRPTSRRSSRLFVAFLGFEGSRTRHLLSRLDPEPDTVAVVGMPGYRPLFPFDTISCHQDFLREKPEARIRLVEASSPFAAFDTLTKLHEDFPDYQLVVAPVGTKPHSLGILLYALDNSDHIEIISDHPRPRPGSTAGIESVYIFTAASKNDD